MIFTQAPEVLIFLVIKNIFLNYILTRSRLVTIFFFGASHFNLVLLYPMQRVAEGIMFLTRPSVSQSFSQSVSPSVLFFLLAQLL